MTTDTETSHDDAAPPSVRDALEAAIETHTPDAAAPDAVRAGGAGTPADAAERAQATLPATPPPDALAPPRTAPAGHPSAAPTAASTPAPAIAEPLAAPASWKASSREYWKTLHPAVQGEIHRREVEHDERMRENAQMRQFAGRFSEITQPYRALMEAEGGDPLGAFHDYLKAATLLRTGAPNDRAAFVAGLVQRYGVPLDALDAYLAQAIRGGVNVNPQGVPMPAPQQPQAFHDPRLDQLLSQLEQTQSAGIRNDVATFAADAKHEFFADVRAAMADLMDAAAKRGVELSLDDAYVRACQIEPEVKKVLDTRAARGNASQAARTLAAARYASASLASGTAPPAAKLASSDIGNPTVRQSLEAALDNLQSAA